MVIYHLSFQEKRNPSREGTFGVYITVADETVWENFRNSLADLYDHLEEQKIEVRGVSESSEDRFYQVGSKPGILAVGPLTEKVREDLKESEELTLHPILLLDPTLFSELTDLLLAKGEKLIMQEAVSEERGNLARQIEELQNLHEMLEEQHQLLDEDVVDLDAKYWKKLEGYLVNDF